MKKPLDEAINALAKLRGGADGILNGDDEIPSVAQFLRTIDENEQQLRSKSAEGRGYALWPLSRDYPNLRSLRLTRKVISIGHKPPNQWAVKVLLARDPRSYTFTLPSQRLAEMLARQFAMKMGQYCIDEDGDRLWNIFVLSAARKVDERIRKVAGIDPPEEPLTGPTTAEGHTHEWHWTGTWSDARPFPVWHMRCACGCWALLANLVSGSGEWVGYDATVHDIRLASGEPAPTTMHPVSAAAAAVPNVETEPKVGGGGADD